MNQKIFSLLLITFCALAFSQNNDAFGGDQNATQGKSLLDPSHFSIHNGVSFSMMSTGSPDVQSQGLYSTMMQYRFTAPVTLNLNFGLPIFSTFSSSQNLTQNNIQSLEYFKNMPLNASLSWKPLDNMLMRFSVVRDPQSYYQGGLWGGYDFFNDRIPP